MNELSSQIERLFSGTVDFSTNLLISAGTLIKNPVRGSLRLAARRHSAPEVQVSYLTLLFFTSIASLLSLNLMEETSEQNPVVAFAQDAFFRYWGLPLVVSAVLISAILDWWIRLIARKLHLNKQKAKLARDESGYAVTFVSFLFLLGIIAPVIPLFFIRPSQLPKVALANLPLIFLLIRLAFPLILLIIGSAVVYSVTRRSRLFTTATLPLVFIAAWFTGLSGSALFVTVVGKSSLQLMAIDCSSRDSQSPAPSNRLAILSKEVCKGFMRRCQPSRSLTLGLRRR